MKTNDEKIDSILKGVQDMKVELAKHLVHQEQHRKEIDNHAKEIEDLKTTKNKAVGIVTLVGIGVSAAISWVFKHF